MRRTGGRADRRTVAGKGTARRSAGPPVRPATLWSPDGALDPRLLEFTVGDDRYWDSHLIRFDVLGSLGHVEGLRAGGAGGA